ncbi:hypothetical protein OG897_27000 [Streptomyces sp. NBC_00237]|uniref:hypothetical protein n=1 Tax=Streptomyces sp. NBC_00237 TaxID=2975687 RepID=UPI0022527ED8|nr:hypothetical protein [Streptomyces sp. NBC_00237]MCX5205091.1 hypothetical protein [Streptomyces sp. NBC_00237]
MSNTSRRPQWTALQRADFDRTAHHELPLEPIPARIPAAVDRSGTEALFGEPVQAPGRPRTAPRKPHDADGQDELF